MIEADVRTFVLAEPAVTSIIGQRLYPVQAEQRVAVPFATYTRISTVFDHAIRGPARLTEMRLQIDSYSHQFDESRALADALRERLDAATGAVGGSVILSLYIDAEQQSYDEQSRLWRVSQDYRLTYR